ncbi:uncharacterized protein IWZ02DRAFT_280819 [Phyllosticta citriasiana]|uniref:uncharacterized protein n=1 Tax=Phyllosticta citriasiana TaxID=595635 RepID=UPI0030FDA860
MTAGLRSLITDETLQSRFESSLANDKGQPALAPSQRRTNVNVCLIVVVFAAGHFATFTMSPSQPRSAKDPVSTRLPFSACSQTHLRPSANMQAVVRFTSKSVLRILPRKRDYERHIRITYQHLRLHSSFAAAPCIDTEDKNIWKWKAMSHSPG